MFLLFFCQSVLARRSWTRTDRIGSDILGGRGGRKGIGTWPSCHVMGLRLHPHYVKLHCTFFSFLFLFVSLRGWTKTWRGARREAWGIMSRASGEGDGLMRWMDGYACDWKNGLVALRCVALRCYVDDRCCGKGGFGLGGRIRAGSGAGVLVFPQGRVSGCCSCAALEPPNRRSIAFSFFCCCFCFFDRLFTFCGCLLACTPTR